MPNGVQLRFAGGDKLSNCNQHLCLRSIRPKLPFWVAVMTRCIRCNRKSIFTDSRYRKWLAELTYYCREHHQKTFIFDEDKLRYHSVSRDLRMVPVSQSHSYVALQIWMPADQQPRHQLSPHSANASAEACGERAERFTPSKPTSFDVLSEYSTYLGARKIPRPANALRRTCMPFPPIADGPHQAKERLPRHSVKLGMGKWVPPLTTLFTSRHCY